MLTSCWVRNALKVLLAANAASLLGWAVMLGVWYFDDAPPFKILSYQVHNARPGGALIVDAHVQRDARRRCSMEFTRSLVEESGVRHTLGDGSFTAQDLEELERDSPGRLVVSVGYPHTLQPGPATLIVARRYSCNWLQRYYPISVNTKYNVEVLR